MKPRYPVLDYIQALWQQECARFPRLADVPFDARNYELQVNVKPGPTPLLDAKGKRWGWSDGVEKWWTIRSPKNSSGKKGEPYHKNYGISWHLHEKAELFGSSGWNWRDKHSHWVGFDFDSLIGHGKGLTDEQLDQVRERLSELRYTTVRRSTSGNGLHVIAKVNEANVRNHKEHKQLATAVLKQMGRDAGYNFAPDLDVYGAILWLWSNQINDRSFVRC